VKSTWIAGALCAALAISALLYTYRLDRVPAYLTLDEAQFSVHAQALAETGRNLNGQWLPPLISLEDPEGEPLILPWGSTYYLPFGMYLIAAALKVLPLTEAAVRTPSALLGGAINVALIGAVAFALFRSRLAAVASAALLALAPANVIISRQALDSVCQLPFILGALWCLATYIRKPDPRLALAAGAILGGGIYAYITSTIFMPLYLALFWFISWRAKVLDRRAIVWSMAGFAAALMPMVLWLIAHPEAARSLAMQYNRADPGSATLMETFASGGAGAAFASTLRIYWSYFDPSFLFIQGGSARNLSTGDVGVFLVPVAIFAPLGVYHLRSYHMVRLLLIIGLLIAPLPAVIKGAPYAIQRASSLLIYVSLLSGIGLASLAASKQTLSRASALLLTALVAFQFTSFYREYHGSYRASSGHAYDSTAFRDAADMVMAADGQRPAGAIYMPSNFYDVGAKWRFYTFSREHRPLWHRTKYFADVSTLDTAPADSLAVWPQTSTSAPPPGGWTVLGVVKNMMGEQTSAVIRRLP
jgi:4-amino-4-deoxy-L-arabinose transferase-like glycosyltransferase